MRRWTSRITELAGGLQVRRLLPALACRSVGPFVFFDHFGPVLIPPEIDTDIGPHPHIGLATVSYLFEGTFLHRDSLGTVQEISPGAVNWMSAGRGIVHSERTPDALRGQARAMHGLQLWVALPAGLEQSAPSFQHVAAEDIPEFVVDGALLRLLVGEAFGLSSPVHAASPTLYLDVELPAGMAWSLPRLAEEMALYSPSEPFEINGDIVSPGEMVVVSDLLDAHPEGLELRAALPTRVVVIGGMPLEAPRSIWWNFVASDVALIDRAAQRWASGEFETIPGEGPGIAMPPRPVKQQA